jgi:hypothetical protein
MTHNGCTNAKTGTVTYETSNVVPRIVLMINFSFTSVQFNVFSEQWMMLAYVIPFIVINPSIFAGE